NQTPNPLFLAGQFSAELSLHLTTLALQNPDAFQVVLMFLAPDADMAGVNRPLAGECAYLVIYGCQLGLDRAAFAPETRLDLAPMCFCHRVKIGEIERSKFLPDAVDRLLLGD